MRSAAAAVSDLLFGHCEAGACLIDCGATAMVAMRRFGVDPGDVDTIFLSHLHGDHFAGLPFLLLEAHFVSHRDGRW